MSGVGGPDHCHLQVGCDYGRIDTEDPTSSLLVRCTDNNWSLPQTDTSQDRLEGKATEVKEKLVSVRLCLAFLYIYVYNEIFACAVNGRQMSLDRKRWWFKQADTFC